MAGYASCILRTGRRSTKEQNSHTPCYFSDSQHMAKTDEEAYRMEAVDDTAE